MYAAVARTLTLSHESLSISTVAKLAPHVPGSSSESEFVRQLLIYLIGILGQHLRALG